MPFACLLLFWIVCLFVRLFVEACFYVAKDQSPWTPNLCFCLPGPGTAGSVSRAKGRYEGREMSGTGAHDVKVKKNQWKRRKKEKRKKKQVEPSTSPFPASRAYPQSCCHVRREMDRRASRAISLPLLLLSFTYRGLRFRGPSDVHRLIARSHSQLTNWMNPLCHVHMFKFQVIRYEYLWGIIICPITFGLVIKTMKLHFK